MIYLEPGKQQEIKAFTDAAKRDIIRMLRDMGVGGTIVSPRVAPRFVAVPFRLSRDSLQGIETIRKSMEQMEHLLGRGVVLEHKNGYLVFQVELPQSLWFKIPAAALDKMAIGLDNAARPVKLDAGAQNHNFSILVAGSPGSGKSELLKTIIYKLAEFYQPGLLQFVVLDEHNSLDIPAIAHLKFPVAVEADDITAQISWVRDQLHQRKTVGESVVRRNRARYPEICLVVDEASGPCILGTKKNPNREHLAMVEEITRAGRKFNIRVILGTQKPTEEDLPGIFSNLQHRFVGKTGSAANSAHLTGLAQTQAHRLTGTGDFLQIRDGRQRRFLAGVTDRAGWFGIPTGRPSQPPDVEDKEPEEQVDGRGRPPKPLDPEKILRLAINPEYDIGESPYMTSRYTEAAEPWRSILKEMAEWTIKTTEA